MKCSHLIVLAAIAGTSAITPLAASAENTNVNLGLSPAVKTAAALPYLSAATSIRNTFAVDADHDHVHGNAVEKTAEGSFEA